MNVEPWIELRPGDTGPAVGGMQYLLRAHGSSIAADGTFSPATAAAVAQFQSANGLPVVDAVAIDTWIRLVVPTRLGSTGEAVRGVQNFGLVRFAETEPVPIDGVFGALTDERVRLFQESWGLTEDGIAGRETWSYLTARRDDLWPLVKPGAREDMARVVQYLLRAHGFDIAADGVYGPRTGEAVRQFDAARRALYVGDIAGNLTWPNLVVTLRRGSTGDAVRALQTLLPRLSVDGAFGPVTEAAVREFQEMFGLVADGIVGQQTWRFLVVPKSE